ncbi:hypothetical protein N9N28_16400 [Rubripirellula amarantea]|nr:hypothetical protein [Rubripirellula amarantea]
MLTAGGDVLLQGTTIENNIANRAGGGIEVSAASDSGDTVTLIGVHLNSNNAGVVNDTALSARASRPGNGGGLHVSGPGNVIVIDTEVRENISASEGGGLWNGSGFMTIETSQIINNTASGNAADRGGGGVFNQGGIITISETLLQGNVADGTNGSGGGVMTEGGILQIELSDLIGNIANRAGGGVEARDGASVQVIDSNFENNIAGPSGSASPGNGGALHVTGSGDTGIVGGTVTGNVAASEGGGLWNGSGTMTVDSTTITGNIARGNSGNNGGGGVFNNFGTLDIHGSTISSNIANGSRGSGGGVLNEGGIATITDTVISGNIANRAGGGIETTPLSTTTLVNVTLDANNAGVNLSVNQSLAPLLAYQFDELGTSATAMGTASMGGDPILLLTDNSGNPVDLRGAPGSGISGRPDDFAIDNTASTGITTASGAGHAADFDGIDALTAFTLSGWFKLPSTASESIGRQDALIENGTISASDTPGGFRLRGGAVADSGTLELRVNNQPVESSPAYTEIGEYVYFAVSYDGSLSSDNVKFYKGTVDGAVRLVDTLTLDEGVVGQENIPLSIGVTRTSGLTINPFNGLLDDIRIDDSVLSRSQLETNRIVAAGLDSSIAANPGVGGGLHVSGKATVEIFGGSVSGNIAAGDGGGLRNSNNGTMTVNGTVIDGNSADRDGGGIYNNGGQISLAGISVSRNEAQGSGGGIYGRFGRAPVQMMTITDSRIADNQAYDTETGSGGGGMYVGGTTVLTNVDVLNNSAVQGTADGGGVIVTLRSSFTATGGEISGNRAARAGGGVENLGTFTSTGTGFTGNFAGVNGGAIHQSGFSLVEVSDAEVVDNTAINEGGGFWASDRGTLTVADSMFVDNAAMFGGAIFGDGGDSLATRVYVAGSNFQDNIAEVNGGGIAVEAGRLFVDDSVLTNNSANGNSPGLGGGAIFTGAFNTITNTSMFGNSAALPLGNGGGIHVAASGKGSYIGGTIENNVAGRAGGGVEVAGSVLLEGLIVDGNSAGINGGGVHISGSGRVNAQSSVFVKNTADGEGGGLWNSAAGSLSVIDTTVDRNTASGDASDQGGGGIFTDGGFVRVFRSTISNNVADGVSGSGGGIFNNGAEVIVRQTPVTGNIAVRAGGGIETLGASITRILDVDLSNNSAGLDLSLAGADVPDPLLLYSFNETGTAAVAQGSAVISGDPMLHFNANGTTTAADLHSADGMGVSGQLGDRAFDNTTSNGFSNVARGQHAADFDAIDALDAFTLSGWFMLPSTSTESIGRQDTLIENGSTSTGVRLRGGNTASSGTLQITVDGITRESSPVYTEIGEYVYFAVSYDGTVSTENVKFYKGTTSTELSLVSTFDLNAGSVDSENLALFVGAGRQSFFQNPFSGFLDNIRIDGSALTMPSLEFLRADAIGQATGFRANPGNGGGLHISGPGTVTLVGGSVTSNFAANEGGGLWNSAAGKLTVDGTSISDNVASGNDADSGGGGVYNDGGTLTISDSVIADNLANGTAGSGGGLLSVDGVVSIIESQLEANGAVRAGGGIEIVDGSLSLVDSELTFNDVNGTVAGATAQPGNGGGLHVTGAASVVIDNVLVANNVAAREGGGLWNQAGTTMTIRNGTVIQNNSALGDAADDGGGGIFNNGGVVEISDSLIVSNFADGNLGSGGGIFNFAGGVITIADTTMASNVANRAGGAIEDASVTGDATTTGNSLTLTRVTLDRNNAGVVGGRGGALVASPGNGGAIHVTGAANVSIIQSTVSDNVAANEGGGLWNGTGVMTINQSTVSGNVAGDGGGIFNDSTSGDVVLTNATISGNSANGQGSNIGLGGGLRTEGGNISLTSVTVAMNDAVRGGGLSIAAGNGILSSSIVAANLATTGTDIDGPITSNGNNVVGNTSGAIITPVQASDRVNLEARLSPLADNGGLTETHALQAGSPALQNGDAAGLRVDQRGVSRPQGGGSDSGSYESALSPLTSSNGGSPATVDPMESVLQERSNIIDDLLLEKLAINA